MILVQGENWESRLPPSCGMSSSVSLELSLHSGHKASSLPPMALSSSVSLESSLCSGHKAWRITRACAESGLPRTHPHATGRGPVVRPPPPARRGLGSIVWLCAQEEKEAEFGKHMLVCPRTCGCPVHWRHVRTGGDVPR